MSAMHQKRLIARSEAPVSTEHEGIEKMCLDMIREKCKQYNFKDKSLLHLIEDSKTPKEFSSKLVAACMLTKSEYTNFQNYFEKLDHQVFRNQFISDGGKKHILQDTTANFDMLFRRMKDREAFTGLLSTEVMIRAGGKTEKFRIMTIHPVSKGKNFLVMIRLQSCASGGVQPHHHEITLLNGKLLTDYSDAVIESVKCNSAVKTLEEDHVSINNSLPQIHDDDKVIKEMVNIDETDKVSNATAIVLDETLEDWVRVTQETKKRPPPHLQVYYLRPSISSGWQHIDHDDDFVLMNGSSLGAAPSEEMSSVTGP